MGFEIHGPRNSDRRYGIRIRANNWATGELVPRVAGLITALEYFHTNNCGLIETTGAVVVGDEQSTQNGATEVIPTENGATLAIVEGDNANFFRSVIVNARTAGVIRDNWIVSILGGVTLTFIDPATMSAPYDLAFAQNQLDYPMRLS